MQKIKKDFEGVGDDSVSKTSSVHLGVRDMGLYKLSQRRFRKKSINASKIFLKRKLKNK